MKTVKVRICAGTTCFVMGASDLQLLEEELPAELRSCVIVEGVHCLGFCKDRNFGKAPFVMIDDEVVSGASIPKLIERIRQHAEGVTD